jgi:hypothetical protein
MYEDVGRKASKIEVDGVSMHIFISLKLIKNVLNEIL